MPSPDPGSHRPHVVIIGGGFGGLTAARALRRAPVRITLVDRRNHHLFQPLLYQVATASLSPAQIAAPIRKILSRQKNAEVILAEAVRIDAPARTVHLRDGRLTYDTLILATGATHSYFGHDDWADAAPGLKTVEDAVQIRSRFLLAFEAAERETDPATRQAELTFVVVGGGPTGVEIAGAMAEIARRSIPRDFRRIDTSAARIILLEAADRLLGAFPPALADRAKRDLEALGVDVRLNAPVTAIDHHGVRIGDEPIPSRCVVWAAGVRASSLANALGVPLDRAGRVIVNPDLSVPGHPEIFVIGDLAAAKGADGSPVPGLAPAAMQMGRHVARLIAADHPPAARPPFRYRDKGLLATIGRAKAVGAIWGLTFTGLVAWAVWALVHITYLIGFRNKILVLIDWAWAYIAFERGSRLITGETSPGPHAEQILAPSSHAPDPHA